ncbi:ArgS-related anticodon-binding protein NrtL [Streptomyces sp. NPDC006879]|uniref:ArgS-related anticodon-binding protein NrtL n=1 Tax=Streptomyces sp. NPDC006879 TaxID=3364767 RepID=UPI0036746679
MTPAELSRTLTRAVRCAVEDGELRVVVPDRVVVERSRPGGRGDYASNVALRLSRAAGLSAAEVARVLCQRLAGEPGVRSVEITGPGFLNFTLALDLAPVDEVRRLGSRYGCGGSMAGAVVAVGAEPSGLRARVYWEVALRLLAAQGARVALEGPGLEAAGLHGLAEPEAVRRFGAGAVRWGVLATPASEAVHLDAGLLVQGEGNPYFTVRYAYARSRALERSAAQLGFGGAPVAVGAAAVGAPYESVAGPGVDARGGRLVGLLAEYPLVLEAAAHRRAPERLVRHLVAVADELLDFQCSVLPLGEEKPLAAHRSRLAVAEAAGVVLAGGLSLLGIDAPEFL